MKSKFLFFLVSALATLTTAYQTKAQEFQARQPVVRQARPAYRLIDLGTFGGPNSQFATAPTSNVLTLFGNAVGAADTSTANPYGVMDNPYLLSDQNTEHAFYRCYGGLMDLGTLPNGASSFADWINQSNQIVGFSENGEIDPISGFPEIIAVLWRNDKIASLGTLGGNHSLANSINDRGQIVGAALNATPDDFSLLGLGTETRAFLWQSGKMSDLGTLGGADAFAFFINDKSQIAGFSSTNSTPVDATGLPTIDPFVWQNGRMTDLGSLGGNLGQPFAMNDFGTIVGYSDIAGDQDFHPFLWNGTKMMDLGTLGGSDGEANAVNDLGEVVGDADTTGGADHAFLWMNGKMHDLLTIGSDACSIANSINLLGQIVGDSGDCSASDHAFLSQNGGPMMNLDSLVVQNHTLTVTSAVFIDDLGEIACRGALPNGDQHACLLVPVLASGKRNEPLTAQADAPLQPEVSSLRAGTANTTTPNLRLGDGMRKRARGLRMARWLRLRNTTTPARP